MRRGPWPSVSVCSPQPGASRFPGGTRRMSRDCTACSSRLSRSRRRAARRLPPGPPIFRYSDDEALATLLAAAGLEVTPPATSTITHSGQPRRALAGRAQQHGAAGRADPWPAQAIQDQIARRSSARSPMSSPQGQIPVSFKIASGISQRAREPMTGVSTRPVALITGVAGGSARASRSPSPMPASIS